jgi:hypothetical protein
MEHTLLILIGVGLICVGFFTSSWALQLFFGFVGGAVIASVLQEVGE